MSNPRDKYGIDRAAEAQGAVVRVDDMEFVVRSTSAANRGYRYALALAAQPRRDVLGQGGIKAFEAHEDILIEAFADCVIVGWRGVTNGHDQPLEFTREACVQLMRDCPAIWDQIREAALDTDRFKPTPAQEDGEQLGKS